MLLKNIFVCFFILLVFLTPSTVFSVYSSSQISQIDTYSIAYGDWGVPNPFHHHRGPSYVLTSFIWDTLVWKNEKGMMPLLASSWSSSADGLVWTIIIRKGVKWHDGEPFTAKDVVFTLKYLKEYPYPFGASDVVKYVEEASALNETAVEIRLSKPYLDFIDVIMGEVEIIPEHIWQNITDPLSYTGKGAYVGTGPYRLVEYKKGEYYLLEANDNYFAGKPLVKKLYLKAVGGPMGGEGAALALKSGDVDAASFYGSQVEVARTFENNSNYKVLEGPSYWVLELIFNYEKYPFNFRDFRVAMAYAINRSEIVDKVLHGGGIVASLGITHPDSKWFNPNLPTYSYNPDKAAKILDSLGFIDRDNDGIRESPNGTKLSFTLLCVKSYAREGELIKNQLSKIGIEVVVKPMDSKPMDSLLDKNSFSMAITGHGGISYIWPGIKSTVDWPAHTYKNSTLDDLLSKFYTTANESERREFAYEIQAIIAGDLPLIALYHPKTYCVYTTAKPIDWFWTSMGIAHGIPIWWNKMSLIAIGQGVGGTPVSPAPRPSMEPWMITAIVIIVIVIIAAVIIYTKRK